MLALPQAPPSADRTILGSAVGSLTTLPAADAETGLGQQHGRREALQRETEVRMQAQTTALGRAVRQGRREIGPIGTATRLIGAGAALALPALLDEFGRWDLLVGLVALPLVAAAGFEAVRAGYERYVPGGLASQTGVCTGAACWLIAIVLAALIPVAAFTPATGTSLWIWIGGSLVLAAVRGYGGCEILAFPNALTGRRDQVGCIVFTPIDRAEARAQNSG